MNLNDEDNLSDAGDGRTERYFADGYHGGITLMRRWGARGYRAAPIWEFDTQVPRWLREHLFRRLDAIANYKAILEIEAITFEHWAEHDPELLSEIVQRIWNGQIEIADGTYTQPYGHIISTESMVRHFLYGQEILARLTGRKSLTHFKQEHMFVPNLPGLLLDAGFQYAILRAHIHHFGCFPAIDDEFILWRGRDGKMIPTVPNYFADRYPYGLDDEAVAQLEAQANNRPVRRMLLSQGRDIVHDQDFIREFVEDWQRSRDSSSCEADLRHEDFILSDWPKMGVSDEQLKTLQRRGYEPVLLSSFIGDYGTDGTPRSFDADYFRYAYLWGAFGDRMLKAIRSAEAALHTAEVTGAFLSLAGCGGNEEDMAALEHGWKQMLEAQSHDAHIAPGSFSFGVGGFPVNMATTWCRSAQESAEAILQRNGSDLFRLVAEPAAQPHILLFNPLSFRRNDPVQVSIELPKGFGRGLRLYSERGELAYDCVCTRHFSDDSLCRADVIIPSDIPGFGFQAIAVEPAEDVPEPIPASTREADTGRIKATVTENGTITALRLSDSDLNWLSTESFDGNELTADFLKGMVRSGESGGSLQCLRGEYLTEFKADTRLGDKPVFKRLRFYRNSDRIDFKTEIDFGIDTRTGQTGLYMDADYFGAVRVNFNPSFEGGFFSDLALSVESSTRRTSPGQTFGCVTNGEFGVTLINRGNIGYYRNEEKGVRMSLILASGDGEYRYGPYALSGKMAFQYSLIPHRGDWVKGQSVLRAAEVNVPVRWTTGFAHLPPAMEESLLSISEDRVVATALFEKDGMMFLRLWNSLPETVTTNVSCFFPLRDVAVTDIFGENGEHLRLTGGRFELAFSPFELKTVVLNRK